MTEISSVCFHKKTSTISNSTIEIREAKKPLKDKVFFKVINIHKSPIESIENVGASEQFRYFLKPKDVIAVNVNH
jgi:hypothetical protein